MLSYIALMCFSRTSNEFASRNETELAPMNNTPELISISLGVPDNNPLTNKKNKQSLDDGHTYDTIQEKKSQTRAFNRIDTGVKINPDSHTNLKEVIHNNVMATANEEKLYRTTKSDKSPEDEQRYCSEVRRMDGGVSKPSAPVYHTLDRDTSIVTPHALVIPNMSKAEHVYHTLDNPKQKHELEVKGDTSSATRALTVPNTTKPEHVYHTLQNPNPHKHGAINISKEEINSQNKTSDTDPKYDEPMFPNRLPPRKITHSVSPTSEEVTRTKNKIVFDDSTYAVNPHELQTDTEAVPLVENRSRELAYEAALTSNIGIEVSTSNIGTGEMSELEPDTLEEPTLVQVQNRAPDSHVTLKSIDSTRTMEAPGSVFDDSMYDMGLNLNSTT